MFEQAGFQGVRILARSEKPWQAIQGIEYRSMTVEATRIEAGGELELNPAFRVTTATESDCCGGSGCG